MSVIFSPVKFTFPNIWFVPIPLFVGELYDLIINLRTICALRVLENERNQSINLQNQHLYDTNCHLVMVPQMVTQNMLRASIKEKRFFLIKNPICLDQSNCLKRWPCSSSRAEFFPVNFSGGFLWTKWEESYGRSPVWEYKN